MTPRDSGQFRRSSDLPWYWQLIHFLLAPLVDHWTGLSLTRLLAAAFTALVCYVSVVTKQIGGGAVTLAIFAIATAFGKTVFTAALQRWGASSNTTSSDTKTVTESTVREIKERRGGAEFEATP